MFFPQQITISDRLHLLASDRENRAQRRDGKTVKLGDNIRDMEPELESESES